MRLPGAGDGALQQVHLEIADAQRRLHRGHRRPARQRVEAGEQFREREGLDEIVVAAGLEPRHPVVDPAQRGQEQHRRLDAGAAQGPDEPEPVEAGQHAVDDQHVVGFAGRQHQAGLAVGSVIDRVAMLLQAARDVGGGLGVVLDQQYLQFCPFRCPAPDSSPSPVSVM